MTIVRYSLMRHLPLLAAAILAGAAVRARAGSDPAPAASPLPAAQWISDGEKISLPLLTEDKTDYLAVEQFARLSQAQLRWQAVSKQVCLNRADATLCFQWEPPRIVRDGRPIPRDVSLRFRE